MTVNEEALYSSIIETVDEEGNPVKFEILDIIELEEQSYALLFPYDENDELSEDDESEAVVMKIIQEGDEYLFEQIEDDEEFEKVSEYIESIKEEM